MPENAPYVVVKRGEKYYCRRPYYYKDEYVVGVCHTGTGSAQGWNLKWINKDFEDIDLPADYFDKHPSWNFSDVTKDENVFCRIPIAYTKRGVVPSGPNANKWYMMLSPVPRPDEGFEPNLAAFMYKGSLKHSFLWGKYRASLENGKYVSRTGLPYADRGSFSSIKMVVESMGDGYHLSSFQEFFEILTRAVIEKKTFDLWPTSARNNYDKCIYRGIHAMAYSGMAPGSSSGETGTEFRDGARTDAGSNIEVWDDSGFHRFVSTGKKTGSNGYILSLLTGSPFDHLYFCESTTSQISGSMIPDYYVSNPNRIGHISLAPDKGDSQGAFFSNFYFTATEDAGAGLGTRFSFIE